MLRKCIGSFLLGLFPAVFSIVVANSSEAEKRLDVSSPDSQTYLERALDLMQKNALHRDSIDWARIRAETLARATNATTPLDTYPAIAFALTQLQEHHSFLEPADNLPSAKREAVMAEMKKIRDSSFSAHVTRSPFASRKEILGHIDRHAEKLFAHVVIPMYIPEFAEDAKNEASDQQFAEKLHSVVSNLQAQKPDGWIVDLRGNGGGNMWPMLAGIGMILGEGDLGAFVSANGDRELWFYQAGRAGTRSSDNQEGVDSYVKTRPSVLQTLPWVAVLVDRGTGSSGEAVAISFAGRPRERSFGEHTAGYSTANEDDPLPDGAVLHLCVGTYADRTGRQYPDGIDPDLMLPAPDSRPAEEQDAVLLAAENWLTTQIGQSR
jgi:carboxyl-terminal processing protease